MMGTESIVALESLQSMELSLFKDFRYFKNVTLNDVFQIITDETLREKAEDLKRLCKVNRDEYDEAKKKLLAVPFSGLFKDKRDVDHLINYTRLLVIDIDKLNNSDVGRVFDQIESDKHIFATWISPSGVGIKALAMFAEQQITNYKDFHYQGFLRIEAYLKNNYGIQIDGSGKDIPRLCFINFSNRISLKKSFVPFSFDYEQRIVVIPKRKSQSGAKTTLIERDALYNPQFRNHPKKRRLISLVIRYLKQSKQSITYSYDEWFQVANAISCEFTFDIGEQYFDQLSQLDEAKYDKSNARDFLIKRYKDNHGFHNMKTILSLANQKGFVYVI